MTPYARVREYEHLRYQVGQIFGDESDEWRRVNRLLNFWMTEWAEEDYKMRRLPSDDALREKIHEGEVVRYERLREISDCQTDRNDCNYLSHGRCPCNPPD
ncbi:MAG: hypothetical protein ISN29_05265 [Gammaproteobacteria bacterium AqS3]|nr:hypothetical protein [Gammaproteobacteria bacterium AqS3]